MPSQRTTRKGTWPPRPRAWLVALTILILWGGFVAGVWWQRLPLGIPGEWVWNYRDQPALPQRLLLTALVAAIAAFVLHLALRYGVRNKGLGLWPYLLLIVFTGWLARAAAAVANPDEPGNSMAVMMSDISTTYYSEAVCEPFHPLAYVGDYPARMPSLSYHAQTHPPGAVLVMYGLYQFSRALLPASADRAVSRALFDAEPDALERTANSEFRERFGQAPLPAGTAIGGFYVAVLLAALGALVSLGVFGAVRELWDTDTALAAALLAAIVPGTLIFRPALDQLTMLPGPFALWLVLRKQGVRAGDALVAGAIVGVGLLVTFALLPVAGLLALVVILREVLTAKSRTPTTWLRAVAVPVLLIAIGAALPSGLLAAAAGYRPLTVYRLAMAAHAQVVQHEWHRTYSLWLAGNLGDWLVGLGVAAAVLGVRHLFGVGRGVFRGHVAPLPLSALLAFVGVLLVLDLSGVVRAEVARIWMFFYPLAIPFVARELVVFYPWARWLGPLVAALQCLQAGVMERSAVFMTYY